LNFLSMIIYFASFKTKPTAFRIIHGFVSSELWVCKMCPIYATRPVYISYLYTHCQMVCVGICDVSIYTLTQLMIAFSASLLFLHVTFSTCDTCFPHLNLTFTCWPGFYIWFKLYSYWVYHSHKMNSNVQ